MEEGYTAESIQGSTTPTITPFDREQLWRKLKEQQNLGMGVLGGVIGMVIGAIAWGVITAFTGYQVGYIAVGIGFAVGFGMRKMGKGFERKFSYIGAGQSLLGCILGDLLVIFIIASKELGIPFYYILTHASIPMAVDVFVSVFELGNLLFYALAVYAGYKYSVLKVTQEQVLGMNV